MSKPNLYPVIWQVLTETDVAKKLNQVYALFYAARDGLYQREKTEVHSLPDAGRPARNWSVRKMSPAAV